MAEQQALPQGQLVDIGTVAAHNIVQTLGLPANTVTTVRDAIRDESKMMSIHFTNCVADMQNQFEIQGNEFKAELRKIKSVYNYARENPVAMAGWSFALVVFGFIVGRLA